MTKNFRLPLRGILVAGTATIALCTGLSTHAQATENDLAFELNAFAVQKNVEILFEPGLVRDQKASSYDETESLKQALTDMLAGTGLSANEAAPGVFVVSEHLQERVQAEDEPSAAPSVSDSPPAATDADAADGSSLDPVSAPDTTQDAPVTQASVPADPGIVRGTVLDDGSNKALAGAIITILETGQTASTNSRGEYRFGAVTPGEYTLQIDYLGTGTTRETILVEAGDTVTLDARMPYFMDTITIQSNRSSLGQALNQQRAADNSATIVAADLLGSFPAENVSEALRRVPGVAFTRDDATGEGSQIAIRGFESEAINIQLNGIQLNGTGIARGVDLTSIQGDNISKITIQKTLLPSQEATGSGGLVEIETKSGLDYGDRYFTMAVEGELGEESKFGDEYEINATGAYKLTDDFGVVATLQYRDTDRLNLNTNFIQTNIPVVPEGETRTTFLAPAPYPFDPEIASPFRTGANYFMRTREETNLTGSLNFAWDVTDNTRLRLDLQRIEREQYLEEQRSTLSMLTSTSEMPIPELGGDLRVRRFVRALNPGLGIQETTLDDTTDVLSFRGETNLNQWDLNYKLGYSKTEVSTKRDSVTFTTASGANSDITSLFDPNALIITDDASTDRVVGGVVRVAGDTVPALNLSQAGLDYISDPDTYRVAFATRANAIRPTEEWTAEASARYNFANSFMDYIEGGFKFTGTERENSDDVLSNSTLTSSQSYFRLSAAVTTLLGDFDAGGIQNTNLGFIGAGGVNVPFAQSGSTSTYLDTIENLLVDDPATPDFNEARFRVTDRTGDPLLNSGAISPLTVTEDRWGAYIQAGATLGDFDFVAGGRFEKLEANGNSISSPSIRFADNSFADRALLANLGLVDFFDSSGTDETFTPTFLVNYRPTENIVYRLGYFRSTVNPDIRQIARPFQVVVDNRQSGFGTFNTATIREANPDLAPTVTDNFDLDVAYYFKDNPGLIRLALFYKDVSNNFSNDVLADEATALDVESRVLELIEPLQQTLVGTPNFITFNDDTVFLLQRPRNGEGGTVYGAEFEVIRQLDFLPDSWPDFLENFTVLANLTWTDSDFPTEVLGYPTGALPGEQIELNVPLERQIEWAGNASISYEQGGFSGRLIYTAQTETVTRYDEYNLNTVTPDFDTLDLRLQYALNHDWGRTIFFFEGDNILSGPETADVRSGTGSFGGSGSPDFFFPTSVQFNGGRTFTLGARMTF